MPASPRPSRGCRSMRTGRRATSRGWRSEPHSILTLYRRLLAVRRAHPALSIGDITLLDTEGDVLAYERRHGAERLIVALNLGGRSHHLALPDWASDFQPLLSTVADAPLIARRRPAAAGGRGRDPDGLTKARKDIRLRIAMLAPISWRTPPRHYGPWELVTSLLTEALVARGVDTPCSPRRTARPRAKLAGVCPAPYSEDPSIDAKVWEMLHVAHVFERASEFDLIHNQADFVPLAFSRLVETPLVTTIHGFSSRTHPARLQGVRRSRSLCRDQRRRSPSGPALCGDDPPRYPAGGLSLRPARQRRPALLRPHPPGQRGRGGHCGGTSRGPAADHGRHRPGSGLS